MVKNKKPIKNKKNDSRDTRAVDTEIPERKKWLQQDTIFSALGELILQLLAWIGGVQMTAIVQAVIGFISVIGTGLVVYLYNTKLGDEWKGWPRKLVISMTIIAFASIALSARVILQHIEIEEKSNLIQAGNSTQTQQSYALSTMESGVNKRDSTIEKMTSTLAYLSTENAMLRFTPTPIQTDQIIREQVQNYILYLSSDDQVYFAWDMLHFKYQQYWARKFGKNEVERFVDEWKVITVGIREIYRVDIAENLAEVILDLDYSPNNTQDGTYKICLKYNDYREEWLIYRHMENELQECSFNYPPN